MSEPIQGHAWGGFGRRPYFRSQVARITSELIGILSPDRPAQAGILATLNETVQHLDLAEAERQFASVAIWGGAGSVCDVFLGSPELDQRHCELLIELVSAFARAGIRNQRAFEIAATYQHWVELGVFRHGDA